MPGIAVIIVAAGRGHRFGAEMPKQFRYVRDEPLIRHAVRAFASHPAVDAVLPVIHPDDAAIVADALDGLDYLAPVAGGAARQDSVRNGLEALSGMSPDLVLVHDAARPGLRPGDDDGRHERGRERPAVAECVVDDQHGAARPRQRRP